MHIYIFIRYSAEIMDQTYSELWPQSAHDADRAQVDLHEDRRGVSVIIPVYNTVGVQILEAVRSVYGQGLQDDEFEILIINDGSENQDTLDVLNEIESWPNVQIFDQENKGQSAARNIGLRAANFKYIACLDSDDYYNLSFFL